MPPMQAHPGMLSQSAMAMLPMHSLQIPLAPVMVSEGDFAAAVSAETMLRDPSGVGPMDRAVDPTMHPGVDQMQGVGMMRLSRQCNVEGCSRLSQGGNGKCFSHGGASVAPHCCSAPNSCYRFICFAIQEGNGARTRAANDQHRAAQVSAPTGVACQTSQLTGVRTVRGAWRRQALYRRGGSLSDASPS